MVGDNKQLVLVQRTLYKYDVAQEWVLSAIDVY
jgi:hypothetical protein